ncbi:hypothetical protein B484DRAFT_148778 [Ochromonadaceae sp. CCMP2298]|nr:hypothetical protein B484DRAFT_148778 [Ochromonadaceae sp. CCMP2298]
MHIRRLRHRAVRGSTQPGEVPIPPALDPMTLYYIWYFSMCALGQTVSYDFLPFLLLDVIVKNSTTRDVLNAVIFPR